MILRNSYHSSTEVAAYLANKAASVSIICRNEVPLEKTLGPKVGGYVKALHESKGVQFVINAEVTAFTSKSGEGSFINYVETVRNHIKLLHVCKSCRSFSKGTVMCDGY